MFRFIVRSTILFIFIQGVKQIDYTLSSFFGIIPDDMSSKETRVYDYTKNQVFSQEDYPKVVIALQEAQVIHINIDFEPFNAQLMFN